MAHKFGVVALIGKPNVGKSTLLNAMVGQKVAIVSDKPQTTRKRLLGIRSTDASQIVFVDTPGVHEPHTRLGKTMLEAVRQSLNDIDAVVWVVDGSKAPDEEDLRIVQMMAKTLEKPFLASKGIVCLNKMDLLKAEFVVDHVERYCKLLGAERYMMTTATRSLNIEKLVDLIEEMLPDGESMYPEDEFTDQSSRFMAAELVREKILIATRREVPHATGVTVDSWEEEGDLVRMSATIMVERAGQKAILIGRGGAFVKDIGTKARHEIELLIEKRVHLDLHVKVREDWRMNPGVLREMEYSE